MGTADTQHPRKLNQLTIMSFIPASYDVSSLESGGNQSYLKLKNGENKLRVLSKELVFGFEYWTSDNKPKRLKSRPGITPSDIRLNDEGKPSPIRELWVMWVWDYSDGQAKIWNFYQMSLKKDLTALSNDEDWGHPNEYDIKVIKSGSGFNNTEYKIIASPKKDLTQSQIDAIEEKVLTFDLNSLFAEPEPLPQRAVAPQNGSKPQGFSANSGTGAEGLQWAVSKGVPQEVADSILSNINQIAQERKDSDSPLSNTDKRVAFIDGVNSYLAEHPELMPKTQEPDEIPF